MAQIKMSRITLRISHEDKVFLEMAASLKHLSLSSYVLSTCIEAANEEMEKQKALKVSREAWEQIVDLLDNPPKPNEKLIKLLREE